MARIVVVANAPLHWSQHLVGVVRDAELVLAADGGANNLARIGVRAAAVIGDLDSLRPGVRRWLGEERVVHRPDQDHTDLDKAIAYAIDERAAKRVTVVGAIGGRVDHTVENLALLARFSRRIEIDAWEGRTHIVPVTGATLLATSPGQIVSLLPVGRCERVRTAGLEWSLHDEPLDLLARTGVANLATSERIEIDLADGCLLVVLHDAASAG
jgi:thiamine pyrophosphokinase